MSTVAELFFEVVEILESRVADYEVIFVDDGSTDESWANIVAVSDRNSHCVGLRLSKNFGQHPAIKAGMERANGDLVVLMDADLQDSPSEILKLLDVFEDSGADIVLTEWESNNLNEPWTSRIFHALISKSMGRERTSKIGTFRLFSARVRTELLGYSEATPIYGPIMTQMGFSYSTVKVRRRVRRHGSTSYTFRKRLALGVPALLTITALPARVLAIMGASLGLFSFIGLFLTFIRFVQAGGEVASTYFLTAFFGFALLSLIFLALSIAIIYLNQILREVQRRPTFHIMKTSGLGLKDTT